MQVYHAHFTLNLFHIQIYMYICFLDSRLMDFTKFQEGFNGGRRPPDSARQATNHVETILKECDQQWDATKLPLCQPNWHFL